MLNLHKRFPNVLLPAVLILLAILANPAAASGRKPVGDTLLPPALRDSFPNAVSYPMTHMTMPTDSALAARMTALLLIQDKVPAESRATCKWWMSGPQPFVESLFPGSRWLLAEKHENPIEVTSFGEYSPQLEFLILHKDRFYRPNEINALWRDAGLSFDTTYARTMARFSLIVASFCDVSHMQWPNPNTHVELRVDTAFPPITILGPMTVESKWGNSYGRFLLTDCIIGGRRGTVRVAFVGPGRHDSRTMVSSVTGLGLYLSVIETRLPEPTGTNGQGHLPGGG